MKFEMTTQKQVRAAYKADLAEMKRDGWGTLNKTDTRCGFVDFVDSLQKDKRISEALAERVTLD